MVYNLAYNLDNAHPGEASPEGNWGNCVAFSGEKPSHAKCQDYKEYAAPNPPVCAYSLCGLAPHPPILKYYGPNYDQKHDYYGDKKDVD